ncbi:MAG: moderate conductance mechanosensitive channel [Candidatus Petromonas sp.]|jgi:small conductance mechanosensitive channel|nr:moderate conductance mechanosensitive channel [Candidatus Petromonas sp.]
MEYTEVFFDLADKFNRTVDFYTNPERLAGIIGGAIKILLILIASKIAIKFMIVIIDKFFENRERLRIKLEENRIKTLKSILKSIARYTIYFIAALPILDTVGVDIKGLIAAAGIGGLAIGFGAQNLVRDVITGFFILFEDQFTVGDYVDFDGKSGIVEEMALRVTKIRDFSGDLHIIPNGAISKVTNRCRGNMRAKVDISIAYEEDIENAIEVLNKASQELLKETDAIVEGPTVLGVTSFGASDVVITTIAKTKPMSQWEVERLMRKRFKQAFDKAGIEIPYPKRVVYNQVE